MERESNPMQAPCRRGCGFYGSPNTDNLCSVCHKEALKKKNQQHPNSTASNASSVSSSGLSVLSSPSTALVSVPSSVMDTAIPTIPIISPVADSKLADNLSENDTACGSASSSVSGADDDKDGDRDLKKKKNRCATCRKKVGLTGFECRCGGMYCAVHRYSDKHECPFDYRLLGATEIRRNNPVVVGEKIKKI